MLYNGILSTLDVTIRTDTFEDTVTFLDKSPHDTQNSATSTSSINISILRSISPVTNAFQLFPI